MFQLRKSDSCILELSNSSIAPGPLRGQAPADILVHPNGKFVYGSNRGRDSIAIFSIDESTRMLALAEVVSTQGATPRGFTFDPSSEYVFVANQGSDEVVTFEVNPDSGTLVPTGTTAGALKPACVKFATV